MGKQGPGAGGAGHAGKGQRIKTVFSGSFDFKLSELHPCHSTTRNKV